MSDNVFVDTNILLYLIGSDARKADVASALLERGGVVSVQVLNEFANVARRKAGLDWSDLHDALDVLKSVLDVRALDLPTHQRGVEISERYGFSIYDGMIVAAALLAGCSTLLSEDMQDGQVLEGLVVRNPFKS